MITENTRKRGWVKNAIIIFLVIMLILTFFSNTIMNYSLPEVAAQYAQPGTITTKVRATAPIESNQSFEVSIDESRIVKAVNVKNGDTIEAGQTLFTLEDTESNELTQAQKTLDELNLAYEKALLSLIDPNYSQENQSIKELKEDLEEAIAERDRISDKEAVLSNAKQAVKKAQSIVDDLTASSENLQDQLSSANDDSSYTSEQFAITSAENALEAAEQRKAAIESQISSSGSSDSEVISLERSLESLNLELSYLQKDYQDAQAAQSNASMLYSRYQSLLSQANNAKAMLDSLTASGTASDAEIAAATQNYESMQAAADAAYQEYQSANSNSSDLTSLQHQIDKMNMQIRQTQEDLERARQEYNQSNALMAQLDGASRDVENAKLMLQGAKNALANAKNNKTASLKSQLDSVNAQLKSANQALLDAKEKQTDAELDSTLTLEQANENIKNIQRNLQDQYIALSQKQETDDLQQSLEELDLDAQRKEIAKQEELIEKLKSNSSEKEITAKYAGIITSIAVVAGDTTTPGSALGIIEVVEKGYTAQISVTTEQARLIKVGDPAEIQNLWYSDAKANVTAIKNDPANPGKSKLVELTVTGDVAVGQQLSFSIGERGSEYEIVVPNSAVREDNNGKFILVVESKSSPLGTRYTASRVDVQVLASDDNNSAISGGLYGYEFVITTSNKPVQAGELVRLPEA